MHALQYINVVVYFTYCERSCCEDLLANYFSHYHALLALVGVRGITELWTRSFLEFLFLGHHPTCPVVTLTLILFVNWAHYTMMWAWNGSSSILTGENITTLCIVVHASVYVCVVGAINSDRGEHYTITHIGLRSQLCHVQTLTDYHLW